MNTPAVYEKVNERIIKAFSVEPLSWDSARWDIAFYDRSGFGFYHIHTDGDMSLEQAIEYAKSETSKF